MKENKFFIISLISLMIFITSFGMVYAEDTSLNKTVSSNNNVISIDNGNNEILQDSTGFDFNSIQTRVDNSNDTVKLDKGNYVSNKKAIVINKSITIDGSSSILDAKGLSDVFYIKEGNSVTLENMNIINSKNTAIFSDNANLHIINCTFSHNNGVLNSEESNIYITGCEFKNNNLMEGYYYIVTTSLSTLRVTDSNFTDNAAGIRFDNEYDIKCTIDSCNFINNGGEYGGALQIIGGIVSNSLFENNKNYNGGAILSYVELDVENCRFINNKASEGGSITHYGEMNSKGYNGILRIVNSTFINSEASEFGNAIYAYCSDVELINSSISSKDNKINNIYIKIGKLKNENSNITPNNIRILSTIPAKFVGKRLTVTYNSGKYYSVRLLDREDNSECHYAKGLIKIYKGNKLIKSFTKKADDFSYFKFKINPKWGIGKFKVVITQTDKHYKAKKFVSYITVKKTNILITVQKSVKKYKKLSIKIKNKSKKPISKIKIKVKVYTGQDYKTFKIKTDNKGIAKLNTNKIEKGKHRLTIDSLNKKYKISIERDIRVI